MTRLHRTIVQKVLYSQLLHCRSCGRRVGELRPMVNAKWSFLVSRYTRCIRCGSANVHRVKRRDRIDSVSTNPLSQALRLTGAPLNKCPACRLQYYDCRPLAPDAED